MNFAIIIFTNQKLNSCRVVPPSWSGLSPTYKLLISSICLVVAQLTKLSQQSLESSGKSCRRMPRHLIIALPHPAINPILFGDFSMFSHHFWGPCLCFPSPFLRFPQIFRHVLVSFAHMFPTLFSDFHGFSLCFPSVSFFVQIFLLFSHGSPWISWAPTKRHITLPSISGVPLRGPERLDTDDPTNSMVTLKQPAITSYLSAYRSTWSTA